MILMLGVLIGTYSSIFVASPALLEIEERTGEKHPTPRPQGPKRPAPDRTARWEAAGDAARPPLVSAMYFDSHCHLTDARFLDEAEAVVERARAAGVTAW
jgi:hypothetical protein